MLSPKDTKLQVAVIFTFLLNAKFTSIHWIAVDPGLLEMSRNDVTVRIDGCFENFAAILLSWMLAGDPHFSLRRPRPFLIFSMLTKKQKKSVREK